ncbi:MCE family protein [Aquihabitans sp. G128]|uniref:MCE family protein n=1 Tax=Aquihabitans sp. G128 TaxID=2849779 RepID=UPI001C230AC2|nr:MCE family protein [Aquihabitans sp. G128]QXC61953.1 MCE family protein [Aquihabitans sp. G128]
MRFASRLLKGLRGPAGRNLVKVTVYSLVCLAVLGALVARIGNIDFFADKTSYQAVLPDVTGLLVNDEVKVAGVAVGKVTKISVQRGKAVVSFEVKPSVKLRSSTEVGVRWRNVLGQKYLYLYPGTSGKALEPGDRLPEGQTVKSADVGEFLNSVGPILRAIDPAKANAFIRALNEALDGNEDKVRSLLSSTANIATDLGGSDQQIGDLIGNLDKVVGKLADRDDDLNTAVTRFQKLSGTLAANNDDLQTLVERFAAVQGKLDTLVSENRTDLDSTIDDLGTIAAVLHDHREDLDTALATLPAGLRPYDDVSSYGQWFQIRVVVTCLANQGVCAQEGLTSDLLSGGAPVDVTSILGFALTGAGS